MTIFDKIKTWFNVSVVPWPLETTRSLALGAGCIVAAWIAYHYIQYLEYALVALVFGYGLIHAIIEIWRNPVKEESKLQEAIRFSKEFEAGLVIEAKTGEDLLLHLKHLIEKHLGHPVTITPAPVIEPPVPPQA